MSSAMVAAAPGEPGRLSQLLPTVKCSTCHQPVPLTELGEHTCSAPPPVPTLPKPSVSPNQVNNLLPSRLQGRVANPPPPNSGNPPRGLPPQHQRISSAASERLRVNTNTSGPSSAGFRSSPLARSVPDPADGTATSPTDLRDPFRAGPPTPGDPRVRNNSFSVGRASPAPPRSAGSPLNGPPPPLDQTRFPPSRTGTPQMPPPNSAPVGMPMNPRSNPTPGRPSFSGMPPPINRNASPAPSQRSIPRNQPSPAPSMSRNGVPPPQIRPQSRGPPPQGPPAGPPPPRPMGPPGPSAAPATPTVRNDVPFPGGSPQAMSPGPPRPPFAGHTPQRSFTPTLSPTGRPGHVVAQSTASFAGSVADDIDTRTGGEAGMAGVGRKGFAAAARAAMFAAPLMRGPEQPNGSNRRPDAPRFLDIDAASRSTDTPPLSAGSGYSSSRSPGPPSPLSQSQFSPSGPSTDKMPGRIPSPPRIDTSLGQNGADKDKTPVTNGPSTPASAFGIRLPFFEKLKNMVPGSGSPVEPTPTLNTTFDTQQKDINHIERSTPTPTPTAPQPSSHSRDKSIASRHTRDDSDGSEYSGLAYAASIDYGDDNQSRTSMASSRTGSQRGKDLPPVPPLPSKDGSSSATGNKGVHFSSWSTSSSATGKDRSDPMAIGKSTSDVVRPGHSRNTSTSSYSSASSVDSPGADGKRSRKNSTAIAMALGLSQTPPSDYSKLGGPGGPTRISRLERKASESSIGGRSVYSRTASIAPAAGGPSAFDMLERTMLKDTREKSMERTGRPRADTGASDLSKKRSMGSLPRQRTAGGTSVSESVGLAYAASEYGSVAGSVASGSRAHRSNTVQGISSPESKAPKLPIRSKTTTAETAVGSSAEVSRPKEGRKKEKACVKCRKLINDGRWIRVDTGSILCERCWKNMYLPKCRRCNLPIEKQAVSSSDGQLKGKYHKECFNCHTCHKPFPDKTFYVFDGKPFCAYHYHEANDSLCAAARCGQPIEGPCAVSHAGDRYHPDCMTCEYPGYPECRERLKEYFEVDGRMLCERHASSSEDDEEWANTKATRRITRFIDLNATNNGGGGGGEDAESGLR